MTNSYQAQSSLASQAQLLSCICCYFKAAVKLPPVHLHYCLKCMHLKHDIEDLSRLPWATNLSLSFRSQNILFFFLECWDSLRLLIQVFHIKVRIRLFFPFFFLFSLFFSHVHIVLSLSAIWEGLHLLPSLASTSILFTCYSCIKQQKGRISHGLSYQQSICIGHQLLASF